MISKYNIFLIGVGGQGIGLLSEVLTRAADYSNLQVKAVDTHGLAQRGGTVTSHVRLGKDVSSPLVSNHEADLVIALERHEALRALATMSKNNGTLVYYDTVLQPLSVRMGAEKEITKDDVDRLANEKQVKVIRVLDQNLKNSKMQNIALLSHIVKNKIIPEIDENFVIKALNDLMDGELLEKNVSSFKANL